MVRKKMVKIAKRKLIQLANTLVITIPNKEFIEKFRLKKGDVVDLVIMDNAILIVDRSTDLNADEIKADLDLAQEKWDEKEDREQVKWFNKHSPEEQAKIRKNWEETKENLTGKFDEKGSELL
jgi:hypothetical protein